MRGQLGRIRSRHDPRTLRLADYLGLPAAPPMRDWAHPAGGVAWGMFLNDTLGCCTISSLGHLLQVHAANTNTPLALTDGDIRTAYEAVGHYDPTDPTTDRGAQMLDALRYARAQGIGGHALGAFVQVDPRSAYELEASANLFGAVYCGADLPLAAKSQVVWDVARTAAVDESFGPNTWGGHAMALVGYDQRTVTFVAWGKLQQATRDWFRTYVSEAWAVLDPLWVTPGRIAPSGFDLAALQDDLARIGSAA